VDSDIQRPSIVVECPVIDEQSVPRRGKDEDNWKYIHGSCRTGAY